MTVWCKKTFVPVNRHFRVVFHSSLKSLSLLTQVGHPELPWLFGLFQAENMTKLGSLTVKGLIPIATLHPRFSYLGLANNLTSSLIRLHFNELCFEDKVSSMLNRNLGFFEAMQSITFTKCRLKFPGTLLESVDPILDFTFVNCEIRGAQCLLCCRWMNHRVGKPGGAKGHFCRINWSTKSSMRRIFNRCAVSMIEKCGGMELSQDMLDQPYDAEPSISKKLEYILDI